MKITPILIWILVSGTQGQDSDSSKPKPKTGPSVQGPILFVHHSPAPDPRGIMDHWKRSRRAGSSLIIASPEESAGIFQERSDWSLLVVDSRVSDTVLLDPGADQWVQAGGKLLLFRLYEEQETPAWLGLPDWGASESRLSMVHVTEDEHPLVGAWRNSVWHNVETKPTRHRWSDKLKEQWLSLAWDDHGPWIATRSHGAGVIALIQLPYDLIARHDVAVLLAQNIDQWIDPDKSTPSPDLSSSIWIEAENSSSAWPCRKDLMGYSGRGTLSDDGPLEYPPAAFQLDPLEPKEPMNLWIRAYEGHRVPRKTYTELEKELKPPTHQSLTRENFTWWLLDELPKDSFPLSGSLLDHPHEVELVDALFLGPQSFSPVWWQEATRALRDRDLEESQHALDIVPHLHSMIAPATRSEWEAEAKRLRAKLKGALGCTRLVDELVPLDSATVRTIDAGDYSIECVHYQTMEGFRVPANLYLPKNGTPPYPAVLIPVGHWSVGKADEALQSQAVDLARVGIAALVPETLGQGERVGSRNSHQNSFSLLMGGLTARGTMLYELKRALDYLDSRPDIDGTRLGSSGSSAGGMDSWLLPALDDRIIATAPIAFITGYKDLVEHGARQCSCVYLDAAGHLFDQSEILALCAPRPCLVVYGERDPLFPAEGTRRMIQEASLVYECLSAKEALESFSMDVGHKHNKEMREKVTGFMKRELLSEGTGESIDEKPIELHSPEELLVFTDLKDEQKPKRDLFSLSQDTATRLREERGKSPESEGERGSRFLQRLMPGEPIRQKPTCVTSRSLRAFGETFLVEAIEIGFRQPIPILRTDIEKPKARVLFVTTCPKDIPFLRPEVRNLVSSNVDVITADLPGTGELHHPDLIVARNGILADQPYLGHRLRAILSLVNYLDDDSIPFLLIGEDMESSLLTELACFVNRDIEGVYAMDFLESFEDLIGRHEIPESMFVPKVFESTDLPELRRAFKGPDIQRNRPWSEIEQWIDGID